MTNTPMHPTEPEGPYMIDQDGKLSPVPMPGPQLHARLDHHLERIAKLEQDIQDLKGRPQCICQTVTSGAGSYDFKPLDPIVLAEGVRFDGEGSCESFGSDFEHLGVLAGMAKKTAMGVDLAADPSKVVAYEIETAWIIEREGLGLGYSDDFRTPTWMPFTDDRLVRFARKIDGETTLAALSEQAFLEVSCALVCDHQWIGEVVHAE